jgi:hypothetical protein
VGEKPTTEAGRRVLERISVKVTCAAYHEAGHIVVAGAKGLRLRHEGIIVDSYGEGLACYCKQSDGTDVSRERIIVATFAGFYAESRFRGERGYPTTAPEVWFPRSGDGLYASRLLSEISVEHLLNWNVPATQAKLQNESKQLIEEHWSAVEALAASLLAKEFEIWKPLKSGAVLSQAATAMYLSGEEVVRILGWHGMTAILVTEC